jgi:hypothetical protein
MLSDLLDVVIDPSKFTMDIEQPLSHLYDAIEDNTILKTSTSCFVLSPVGFLAPRVAIVNERSVAFEDSSSFASTTCQSGGLFASRALHVESERVRVQLQVCGGVERGRL